MQDITVEETDSYIFDVKQGKYINSVPQRINNYIQFLKDNFWGYLFK